MSNFLIQTNMLCASEFALAIALTVFILITVILAMLLIFLAASKNFRTVFFREKPQKKRSSKKQTTVALSEPSVPGVPGVDTIPIEPAPKTRRAATKRSTSEPSYLNAIPTVPLGGIPAPTAAPKPRASRRAAAEDALNAMPVQESGSTYTTRSITITRARSTRASQAKAEPTTPKNNKKDKA